MATQFVDSVTLHVSGGDGGHGVASIRREKFKPLGGPDGANGGSGGTVFLEVDSQTTTLLPYHRGPHRHAESGGIGRGDLKNGAEGEDLVLPVPEGTVVKDLNGTVLADLVGPGTRFVAAAGGRGGLGNAALATSKRKAPGFALLGEPGEERSIVLELKTVADVALVGFPSAGKSSLIAALSAARPKIADYPFTTLVPNLGVVEAGGTRFTVADVPGLIPGASQGKGLGLEFLRHVERCAAIAHVIDMATYEPGRDPISDFETIEAELAAYSVELGRTPAEQAEASENATTALPLHERPTLVVLNKVDSPDGRELAEIVRADIEAKGHPVFEVSALSHEGLRPLTFAMAKIVEEERARQAEAAKVPVLRIIRPVAVDDAGFTVTREQTAEGEVFRILGDKPQRWIVQTDFANDEAVGYLSDRLEKLGVEQELFKAGAMVGSTVVVGPGEGVIFDWDPTMVGGAELLGGRGSDLRLDQSNRPTRSERRDAYHDKMDAKAETRAEFEAERLAEKAKRESGQ